MPLATSIDHSGRLRTPAIPQNSSSRKEEQKKKKPSTKEEEDEQEVTTTTTGGDIWNHIILKQYYSSDDGSVSINSATSSSSENKSGRNRQQQQPKIMKKSSVPSPPETSRPRPLQQQVVSAASSTTSSSTAKRKSSSSSSQTPATSTAKATATAARNNSKGPKKQQQQQKSKEPPIPRPSGTNWNNRTLPTAPPLTTNNNSERSTLSNNTNRSNTQQQQQQQQNQKRAPPIEVSNSSSSSSSSSSHSSSLSSETLSSGEGGGGGGGKQKQTETLHPSREIAAASVAAALASTSNTSYKQSSQPPPPPPPPRRPPQVQPRQPSLKSKEPPPKTSNIKVQQRPRMQVQQLNRRAGLQQTRAMASIPNLTNWNDPKYQSPNSPKKAQKQTLGEALSNAVHDVVSVVTPHAAADAANNNTRAAAAAKEEGADSEQAKNDAPTTTNAHTGVKEKSDSRFGFCRSTGFWYFVIWATWLLGGTAFYGYGRDGQQNLTLGKAFYMAVNIGYSIGFGYPAEVDQGGWLWFSTFYVLVGSSLVAVALGFFADKIVEDADDWFINLLQKQEYKRKMTSKNYLTRIRAWITYNMEELRSIGVWVFWICMMIMYSMIHIGWPVSQAQYFAISSCSTGGHWSIPIDSPDWFFGITGLVVAFGVPIMGVAMATIGQFIAKSNKKELEDIKDTINAPVTSQEIKMMQQFGLEDGDGEVDEAEFIILCMCRLGTDPRIIEYIGQRFRKLDVDGGGSLSMREIVGRDSLDDDMPLNNHMSSNDMSLNDIQEGDDEDESESTSNPI